MKALPFDANTFFCCWLLAGLVGNEALATEDENQELKGCVEAYGSTLPKMFDGLSALLLLLLVRLDDPNAENAFKFGWSKAEIQPSPPLIGGHNMAPIGGSAVRCLRLGLPGDSKSLTKVAPQQWKRRGQSTCFSGRSVRGTYKTEAMLFQLRTWLSPLRGGGCRRVLENGMGVPPRTSRNIRSDLWFGAGDSPSNTAVMSQWLKAIQFAEESGVVKEFHVLEAPGPTGMLFVTIWLNFGREITGLNDVFISCCANTE